MKITAEDLKLLYSHDLYSFTKFAFHILHPGVPYLDNWHIELLADYLTRVERGEINRLIINMPPRMLKSFCTSIAFVSWMLGRDPTKKILCLSAGITLGKDLEESFRDLTRSPRYRSVFPESNITEQARKLQTPYGGYRRFLPMDAKLSGIPADIVIVDDPISASDALDNVIRKQVNDCFDQNVLQRLDNKKEGAIIVVMQRLHEDDLSGHLLKKEGWEVLNLSAFALEEEVWKLPSRTIIRHPLEPLHPAIETFEDLVKIRYSIGGEAFGNQYLQRQLVPSYAVITVPKEYEMDGNWKEANPLSYFKETFLRDHGLVVVPEAVPAEEWEALYSEKALGTYRPELKKKENKGE